MSRDEMRIDPEVEETGSGRTQPVTKQRSRGSVPHLSLEERAALGKKARARVPRERNAEYASPSRPDPLSLLEEQAATRVPELVPIRYGRMSASPFAFFRGAALIMASDLSTTPVSGLKAQLCGDAHLSNFGLFASPERHMVFDINDFDETCEGPWEWDVKRLAASIEIAGRDLAFTRKQRRAAVIAAANTYRSSVREFAGMPNLAVWYAHIDVDDLVPRIRAQVDPARGQQLEKALAKMRTRDSLQAFTKLTEEVDGEPRIVSQPPLIVRLAELLDEAQRASVMEELHGVLRSYRKTLETDRRRLLEQFRLVDVARKVVGVGSVGTRAWIALLLGRDDADPLILQVKEAEASVLERFAGRSPFANHGQRVVAGQRLMQASSDIFLGWTHVSRGMDGRERDFYFRQFRDWKGSVEIETLRPEGLVLYARECAWTLARAHARSGDRIAIAAYLGKSGAFDTAIAEFAELYADQNQLDYEAILVAIKEGRIQAETGL